jgi:hypothetical protein
MAAFYWERHPDGPFVTLIAVATTYLDPENYDLDALKRLARRKDNPEMQCSRPSSSRPSGTQASCQAMSYRNLFSTMTAATRRSFAGSGATCTATSLPAPRSPPPPDNVPCHSHGNVRENRCGIPRGRTVSDKSRNHQASVSRRLVIKAPYSL